MQLRRCVNVKLRSCVIKKTYITMSTPNHAKTGEKKRTSISLKLSTLVSVKKRAADLGVPDNAVLEAAVETYLVTELEQSHACRRCKSVSYAACNHVQIKEIGDSVLKTEKSGDLPLNAGTLTDDEITLTGVLPDRQSRGAPRLGGNAGKCCKANGVGSPCSRT